MAGFAYPDDFPENVARVFGAEGRAWLERLPAIVEACRALWGLPAGSPASTMNMNYIEFTATPGGEAVALKVGVPHPELYTEMDALALYRGRGAVRLLAAGRELGAILEQRALPGTMLRDAGDNREQTSVAAATMRVLARPVPARHAFPAFGDWVGRAFRLTRTVLDPGERMPRFLLDQAERALAALLREDPARVVLHGDLHHENILLDAEAGWLAIDPKGVIGPRCLEVGRFVQNQLPADTSPEGRAGIVRERIEVFSAELGLPRETVAASALVDCVLSHCWSLEDATAGPEWHLGVELGRLLCSLLQADAWA